MKTYIIEVEGGETAKVGGDTYEEALETAKEYIKKHYGDSGVFYELGEEEPSAAERIRDVTAEVVQLLLEKNKKYGDNNLTKFGHTGILVRLHDKLARLENLKIAGADSAQEYDDTRESIEDVYKDIAGYGILGLKLMREGRL